MSASIVALNPAAAAWIGSAPAGHAGRVGGVGGAHGTEVAERRAQRLKCSAGPACCDLDLENRELFEPDRALNFFAWFLIFYLDNLRTGS